MGAEHSSSQIAKSAPMTPTEDNSYYSASGLLKQSTSMNVTPMIRVPKQDDSVMSSCSPVAADLSVPPDTMRRRTKSESVGNSKHLHFADFSLFPDRYDDAASRQRQLQQQRQMNIAKSATTDGLKLHSMATVPEVTQGRQAASTVEAVSKGFLGLRVPTSPSSQFPTISVTPGASGVDSNFLESPRRQDFPYMDYSMFPEKDPRSEKMRSRMSSTGEEIPRDAARNEVETARRTRGLSESAASAKSPTKSPSLAFFDFSMFPDKMEGSGSKKK